VLTSSSVSINIIIDWSKETLAAACEFAYVDENGNHIQNGAQLAMPYYQHVFPTVEIQIAKAAVRLANIVNHILG
jgi:hypothetical protein